MSDILATIKNLFNKISGFISNDNIVQDFNKINSKHLTNAIRKGININLSVRDIREYNQESVIYLPTLEGRNLPVLRGANSVMYYLQNKEEDFRELQIGHSYLFSASWHSKDIHDNYFINSSIIEQAYNSSLPSHWDNFVSRQLEKICKTAIKYTNNNLKDTSNHFRKKYIKGLIEPMDYVQERPLEKELVDLLWAYASERVRDKVNKLQPKG